MRCIRHCCTSIRLLNYIIQIASEVDRFVRIVASFWCCPSFPEPMMSAARLPCLILILVAIAVPSLAQTDTILPNPKLVKLHRIWLQMGNYVEGGDNVGEGAGTVGDIDGD